MTTSSSSVPRPQAAEAALPMLLRLLRMARMRSHWQSIASQAESEGWSHSQFLYALCEQEVEQRQQARQQRLLRAAPLPQGTPLRAPDRQGQPARCIDVPALSLSNGHRLIDPASRRVATTENLISDGAPQVEVVAQVEACNSLQPQAID